MQHNHDFHDSENPYATPRSDEPPRSSREDSEAGELRPFQTIWLRPRRTVRRIVAADPELHVLFLVALAGIGQTLDRASMRDLGDRLPLPAIVGVACVFGPIGGLMSLLSLRVAFRGD